jgi:hypothetical protein
MEAAPQSGRRLFPVGTGAGGVPLMLLRTERGHSPGSDARLDGPASRN